MRSGHTLCLCSPYFRTLNLQFLDIEHNLFCGFGNLSIDLHHALVFPIPSKLEVRERDIVMHRFHPCQQPQVSTEYYCSKLDMAYESGSTSRSLAAIFANELVEQNLEQNLEIWMRSGLGGGNTECAPLRAPTTRTSLLQPPPPKRPHKPMMTIRLQL